MRVPQLAMRLYYEVGQMFLLPISASLPQSEYLPMPPKNVLGA